MLPPFPTLFMPKSHPCVVLSGNYYDFSCLVAGSVLGADYQPFDLPGGGRGTLGQLADFLGNNGKALARSRPGPLLTAAGTSRLV